MTTLLTASVIASGGSLLRPGWLEVDGSTVLRAGAGQPGRPADVGLGELIVVPGFVDLHVHGGGGGTFGVDDAENRQAVALHRSRGTTRMLASLVSASRDALVRSIEVLSASVDEGLLAGVHLEGPWLAGARRGAHRPEYLRDPEPAGVEAALRAGRGAVRMITFAPERAGALAAIRRTARAGVVAAVGHTDAGYELTRQAIDAGARVATHVFNAMRPVHHRDPGPVVAVIEDDRVSVELVLDGTHLHPAIYRWVVASTSPGRPVLVTDAMAAAGAPDGRYQLGGGSVEVRSGVARSADGGALAGSTATMDQLFRNAVAYGGGGDDALLAAVRQTSTNPADALGWTGHDLTAGGRADLVALDAALAPVAVMISGSWLPTPG